MINDKLNQIKEHTKAIEYLDIENFSRSTIKAAIEEHCQIIKDLIEELQFKK